MAFVTLKGYYKSIKFIAYNYNNLLHIKPFNASLV